MIKVEDLLVLLVFGYLRYIWWKRTNHFAGHINGRIQVKVKNKGKKKQTKGKKNGMNQLFPLILFIYIRMCCITKAF